MANNDGSEKGSYEHYLANPDMYCTTRAHPEMLNWGAFMSGMELQQAGYMANRVSIPGDWDYEGVAC